MGRTSTSVLIKTQLQTMISITTLTAGRGMVITTLMAVTGRKRLRLAIGRRRLGLAKPLKSLFTY